MKIYKYNKGKIENKQSLYEALEINLKKKEIISFVGGGGKTTSIYKLAEELSNLNKKVIVTTTTHMQKPKDKYIISNNIYEINEYLNKHSCITVGGENKQNKIASIDTSITDKLFDICDYILVEADGAKMLPFKAPAEHEPVILNGTTMVVGVCGIDSLNKRIGDICHRPEIVCKIINKDIDNLLTQEDIAKVLSSREGQMKNVVNDTIKNTKYRVLINKVDNNELLKNSIVIAKLLEVKMIKTILTSYIL